MLAAFRSEEVDEEHPLRKIAGASSFGAFAICAGGNQPAAGVDGGTAAGGGRRGHYPTGRRQPLHGIGGIAWVGRIGGVGSRSGWLAGRCVKNRRSAILQPGRDIFGAPAEICCPKKPLRLLSHGAVLGKEFELNIAAELADQSPAQAITALDVARQRRLVWLRPDGSHCVFVHDKIRSALLESQAEARPACACMPGWPNTCEQHSPQPSGRNRLPLRCRRQSRSCALPMR